MPEEILVLSSSPVAGEQPRDLIVESVEVFTGFWGTWRKTDLIPQWVIWSTAESGLGRAQFLNRYGERFKSGDAGDTGNQFSVHEPVVLHLLFIKIVIGGSGLTEIGELEKVPPGGSLFRRVWVGQIDGQATALGGSSDEIPSGTQIIVANSIENTVFGKHFVLDSVYTEFNISADDPDTEEDEGEIKKTKTCSHGITFNENGQPNQAGTKIDGKKRLGLGDFMTRPNRGHGDRFVPVHWSTRDIVEYAIDNWVPVDSQGTELFEVRIDVADLARLPNWDQPVLETHGFRPIEILRRLLSRRRLLVWWLEIDEDERIEVGEGVNERNLPVLKFRVQATTGISIQATATQAIPANDNWLAIDADDDASSRVQLEQDNNSLVDQVVVQGARRRNVMTLDFETPDVGHVSDPDPRADPITHRGSPYWFPSIQAGYEAGASNTLAYRALKVTQRDEKKRLNDQERSRDQFKDVFRRFGMSHEPGLITYAIPPDSPTGWVAGVVYSVGDIVKESGFTYEVLTSSGNKSNGTLPEEDTAHTYEVFYKNCFGQLRLLQKLPLLENHDYSGNNIASGNTENTTIGDVPPQELDMFVAFWIESKKKPGSDIVEGRYVFGSKLSQTGLNPPKEDEDRDWSTTVRVVRGDTSFLLTVNGTKNRPHTIAKETFTGIIDLGFVVWAVGRTYSIDQIVQDSSEVFFVVTAGTGPSAGDDSDLVGGSDTGYSYATTMKPESTNIDDEDLGKVDWRKMRATICYEDDRFCESIYPPKVLIGLDNVRVLRVDAGKDYRLDWVQPETVVDLDEEGNAVTSSSGGYIRDDRLGLEEIARRAYGFYGVIRGILKMSMDYRNTASGIRLGRLVSKIRNGSENLAVFEFDPPDWQPKYDVVDSVITEIRVDFPYAESETPIDRIGRPKMSIQTSFGELDPKFFVRGAK